MSNDDLDKLFSFATNETVRNKLEGSKERISRSFDELFSGYNLKSEDILNDVVHVKDYQGIVEMRDIQFYSMCEHHFAPFFGTVDIYYQPNEIITGLGKLVRLAKDVHGRRLQIQEIMTKNICEDIMTILKAKGCFVKTTAKHLCICSRGPNDDQAYTICNYGMGTLKDFIWNNIK